MGVGVERGSAEGWREGREGAEVGSMGISISILSCSEVLGVGGREEEPVLVLRGLEVPLGGVGVGAGSSFGFSGSS